MSEDDKEIWASRDMLPPLEDDVMNEWEAFFIQVQADFEAEVKAISKEFNELRWEAWEPGCQMGRRPSQARIKAAKERQKQLSTGAYLMPIAILAGRLCQATTADPPTLTEVQAARGWLLVDAMLRGLLEATTRKPQDALPRQEAITEGVTGMLEMLARDIWRNDKLSVLTERGRALTAWEHRHDKPEQPTVFGTDKRQFPAPWIVAVANGEMTPQQVADKWLNGEEPVGRSPQ